MNASKKISGAAVAAAAAALLATGFSGATIAGQSEATVKCSGVNACKGMSACATATNACAGHNSCKGQGWIKTSKEECDKKGGKVQG